MTDAREETQWKPLKAGAFMDGIGPVLAAKDADGGYIYALEVTEAHVNALGLVHGGVISALLDQAIAMVAWRAAERAPTVTVQMNTRFTGAAKPGARLEARALVKHQTGSMMFLDAEVTDSSHPDPRPVALATAIMKISRKAG